MCDENYGPGWIGLVIAKCQQSVLDWKSESNLPCDVPRWQIAEIARAHQIAELSHLRPIGSGDLTS